MLEGDQVRRLYDALEALAELAKADRARREYQSRVVRTPERRAELQDEFFAAVVRHVAPAARLGMCPSCDAYAREAESELDRLLQAVGRHAL